LAKRSLQDDYQRFVKYWEALNRPPPPPPAPPSPPPEPIELVQAQINAHEGSEGTAVHGLGSAALEDKEAFVQPGYIDRVLKEAMDAISEVEKRTRIVPTAAEIGADEVGAAGKVKLELWKHEANQDNPHNVTAEQVGVDPNEFAKTEHFHPRVKGGKGGSGGGVTREEKALLEYILENGNLPAGIYGDELLGLIM